jgi:hypothetical protein
MFAIYKVKLLVKLCFVSMVKCILGIRLLFVFINHLARFFVYEKRKRELKRILIYEYWCNERLKAKLRDVHASHTLGCVGDWNT